MKNLKKIILGVLGILGIIIIFVVALSFYAAAQPAKVVNEKIVFKNRLVIPPLLEPRIENNEKVFDLTVQEGETEIFAGKKTDTWGYNGNFLGPTIRARTGDKIRMQVTNKLSEITTVHWHGLLLPAAMDGGPHQAIKKGETWSPTWTITNNAATFWYHPHTMEKTATQVYRGLAGLFIIDDEQSDALNLPKDYGIDDIPLVIQDRQFDANGQLVYDHRHMEQMMGEVTNGMMGDTILVNGTHAPYAEVPAKLVRLRVLNGSNARRYNFGFSDNRAFYQIATDGGFLPAPVKRTRMQLSPGERAEILVDVRNVKEPLTFMSYAVEGDKNKVRSYMAGMVAGATDEGQQFKILELRPKAGNFSKQEIPPKLVAIQGLDENNTAKTRLLRLDTAAINGKKMDVSRVDEIVHVGDREIWQLRNESPVYHPIHIHGVQFLVLSRNGQKPQPYEAGWKDTITLNPEEDVQLIMKFSDYTDSTVAYMFHCHNLEHEDMGMMGQFVVVDKNTKIEDIKVKTEVQDNYQTEMQHMVH